LQSLGMSEIQVNRTTGSEAHCLYGLGYVSMVLKLPDALPFLLTAYEIIGKFLGILFSFHRLCGINLDAHILVVWNKSTYILATGNWPGYRGLSSLQEMGPAIRNCLGILLRLSTQTELLSLYLSRGASDNALGAARISRTRLLGRVRELSFLCTAYVSWCLVCLSNLLVGAVFFCLKGWTKKSSGWNYQSYDVHGSNQILFF